MKTDIKHSFIMSEKEFFDNNHNICILSENMIKIRKKVYIHDDYVILIQNSLHCIPTRNYKNSPNGHGLFYHGITILDKHACTMLNDAMENWIHKLEGFPERIVINNFSYNKNEITEEFLNLKELCLEAIESNSYIIHFGI